jgi:hypothetical protein
MSYRPLAILVTFLSSVHVTAAGAQTVYVAPGGVYVGAGAGPIYVTPPPPNLVTPYEAPQYAPPAYLAPPYGAPAPRYEAAPSVYGDNEGIYVDPYATYGSRGPVYRGRARVYGTPRTTSRRRRQGRRQPFQMRARDVLTTGGGNTAAE